MNRKNKSNENPANEPKPTDHQQLKTYQISELDYRALFHRNPNVILVFDRDGKFISVNPAGEKLSGYSSDELVGMPFTILCPHGKLDEYKEHFRQGMQGNSMDFETVIVCKDGQYRDISVTGMPLMSGEGVIGLYAIIKDITEFKNANQLLHEKVEDLETIFKAIPDLFFRLDSHEVIVHYYAGNEADLYVSPVEFIGKTMQDVLPSDVGEKFHKAFLEVTSTNSSSVITYSLEMDGFEKHFEARVLPCGEQVVVFVRDITERKQAEEHLRESRKQAEAANIAKSQFLANMSHEIRTPISVIMGFVDLMAMNELTDDEKSNIEIAQKAGKSLVRIIDDILDVSRIEVGALELHLTEFRLKELLDGVESMVQPLADEKGLQLAVILSDRLPVVIHTDYGRVQQCLLNLINNAIKFTEKGHVCVRASLEEKDKKPFLRIDVEDTGIGIPSDRLDSVFDSFSFARLDVDRTHVHSGTGLGLTITRQLARLLGGDVTVTSEIDKGSIFSLVIPAGTAVLEEDDNEPVYESQKKETPRFSGKVLIVDDNEGIRRLFGRLLEHLGLEVTLAKDGEEAIEIVLQQSFDLIFMDVQMPKCDGLEATRRLREKGIATPIVALTAYAMESDRKECLEAKSDDYLSKPIDREALKRILRKYVPAENDSA